MSEAAEKLAYTIDQAAAALAIGRSTLYRQIAAGRLSTYRFLDKQFVKAEELRRFRDEIAGGPPNAHPGAHP